MKKLIGPFLIFMVAIVFVLGFDNKEKVQPNEYFAVYLDGIRIGTIKDKEEFSEYIDKQGKEIKENLGVDFVFGPESLDIERVIGFSEEPDENKEVFSRIFDLRPLTVKGYEFVITQDDEDIIVNTISEDIFEDAVRKTIETFVGKENYELFNDGTAIEVNGIGKYIDNIYIENEITYKEKKISVDKKIHTDINELSNYFLFGPTKEESTYTVKTGDTIESVSLDNKISPEEFLISNPKFDSKNNLLFEDQEVVIGVTDPQLRVVVEEQIIEETKNDYRTEYKYDPSQIIGYERTIQKGEPGLDLITRNVKKINNVIVFAENESQESIIPSITEIVVRGEKEVPSIANQYSWRFPTPSGYILTQNYGYRIHPITYQREFHRALDIAIGYGASVYTANNGVVYKAEYNDSYGHYIVINHNQGNYTLYAHLSSIRVRVGQTVQSGSVIGYMGSTGMSTGPHLHFEVWKGAPYRGGVQISPWTVLR